MMYAGAAKSGFRLQHLVPIFIVKMNYCVALRCLEQRQRCRTVSGT